MTTNRYPFTLTLLALICAVTLPAPAPAQELTELDGTPIPSGTRRAWIGNYREFSRFVGVFEDQYIVLPNYERRNDNSHGVSAREAEEALKISWTQDAGVLTETRSWTPPREEIEAYTKLLPSLKLGSFGYVHSVEVVEVLGPEQMLVTDLWILDADLLKRQYDRDRAAGRATGDRNYTKVLEAAYRKRLELADLQDERAFRAAFRLVGYSTRGVQPGQRYAGPGDEGFQVAFANWDLPPEPEEGSRRRSRPDDAVAVLIDPAPVMRETASEQQFIELLGQKDITIAGFVELVRAAREADRDTADALVLAELMPAGPDDEED